MRKLVVRSKDVSCCIDCDYVAISCKRSIDEKIIIAYQGSCIVGIFKLDDISAMYLSEKKDG